MTIGSGFPYHDDTANPERHVGRTKERRFDIAESICRPIRPQGTLRSRGPRVLGGMLIFANIFTEFWASAGGAALFFPIGGPRRVLFRPSGMLTFAKICSSKC